MSIGLEEKISSNDVVGESRYTYDEAVELIGHGRYNYLLLAACSVISHAVAMDMFGFSVVVPASSCDLNLGLTETGLLASTPFAGILFAFPWGYYADTRGRRRALIISTSVGFGLAALSSISCSWEMMLVLKFLGCSFSTASYSLSITYLGECTGSKHRNQYLSVMNSCNLASEIIYFGLAYIVLRFDFNIPIPWLAITFRPWRLFTFILALPLGIGAFLMIFLHESPKFLADRGENEKALEVLKKIYATNRGDSDVYPVRQLISLNMEAECPGSLYSDIVKQIVPIFQPPLLLRSIQLFFLIAVGCSTNNAFLMWFPTMLNMFFKSISEGNIDRKSFCERINVTVTPDVDNYICDDRISDSTIYSGILYGLVFTFLGLVVSKLAVWRKQVVVGAFFMSAVSGFLLNVVKHPVANIIFFTLLQVVAVSIGCIASYFVDLYPTAYRGLATSVGMMVARLISFSGVNLVGALIVDYCTLTFYCWSSLVLSAVVVAVLLPSNKSIVK